MFTKRMIQRAGRLFLLGVATVALVGCAGGYHGSGGVGGGSGQGGWNWPIIQLPQGNGNGFNINDVNFIPVPPGEAIDIQNLPPLGPPQGSGIDWSDLQHLDLGNGNDNGLDFSNIPKFPVPEKQKNPKFRDCTKLGGR